MRHVINKQNATIHNTSNIRACKTVNIIVRKDENAACWQECTPSLHHSYGEKPVVSKTSRFNMLAYFILVVGLFARNLAYFLKRLVLKQQVFPRINHKMYVPAAPTLGKSQSKGSNMQGWFLEPTAPLSLPCGALLNNNNNNNNNNTNEQ